MRVLVGIVDPGVPRPLITIHFPFSGYGGSTQSTKSNLKHILVKNMAFFLYLFNPLPKSRDFFYV